jgi:thiamine phosphate synthase YjbQ (UPF0047 family)
VSRAKVGRAETLAAGAAARQALGRLMVETAGPGFTEITAEVARWLEGTVGRHVVRPLGVVHVTGAARRETVERRHEVGLHVRIGVLLDRQRRRGVAAERGEEPVADAGPRHADRRRGGGPGARRQARARHLALVEHRDQPHRREIVLHVIGA